MPPSLSEHSFAWDEDVQVKHAIREVNCTEEVTQALRAVTGQRWLTVPGVVPGESIRSVVPRLSHSVHLLTLGLGADSNFQRGDFGSRLDAAEMVAVTMPDAVEMHDVNRTGTGNHRVE